MKHLLLRAPQAFVIISALTNQWVFKTQASKCLLLIRHDYCNDAVFVLLFVLVMLG